MARIKKNYSNPAVGDSKHFAIGQDGEIYSVVGAEDTDIILSSERIGDSELTVNILLPKGKTVELTDTADPDKGKQIQAILACISQHKVEATTSNPKDDDFQVRILENSSLAAADPDIIDHLKLDFEKAVQAHNDSIADPVIEWDIPENNGDEVIRFINPDGSISDANSAEAVETALKKTGDATYELICIFPASKVSLAKTGKKIAELVKGLKIKAFTSDIVDDDTVAFEIETSKKAEKKAEKSFDNELATAIKQHNSAIAPKSGDDDGKKAQPTTDEIKLAANKSPNGSTLPNTLGIQKRATENYIRLQKAAGLAALLPEKFTLADGTVIKTADVS